MRKAAGILFVLFFATLVVITTTSGDETDNSHLVHTDYAYGPGITCDTSCHVSSGMTIGGDFLDGYDLTSTNQCDSCHSPGGDYDGVDHATIGAKTNWATGVFTGSDFQTGKEKWCVGCHDDIPSVINSVSAPNIAGENATSYGYYMTGHGRHQSGIITCLACHDPAVEHVDGVARTYSPVADNYQAGYRLKSVGKYPVHR
jgi:hypothetical protein